jgi:hypothetical protein
METNPRPCHSITAEIVKQLTFGKATEDLSCPRSAHSDREGQMMTQQFLSLETDFNLLSLRDLLAARDQFHLHLSQKPNVVATAVGYYRIRTSDPWPNKENPKGTSTPTARSHPVRTLQNSERRPYSWPAILVFVDRWVQSGDFSHPDDAVPTAVYMPNGQKVPICVVQVDKDDMNHEGDANYSYPASVMGGGFPVICDVQGKEHVGSVACLVSNGHRVFALTNRHVAGESGAPISAIIGKNKERIGSSAASALRRAGPQPFSPVPPPFPKASEPSPSAWQASDRQYPQAAACPQRIRLAPP